jgi:hypothetical protein
MAEFQDLLRAAENISRMTDDPTKEGVTQVLEGHAL